MITFEQDDTKLMASYRKIKVYSQHEKSNRKSFRISCYEHFRQSDTIPHYKFIFRVSFERTNLEIASHPLV
jgi:hypothetical protein